MSRKVNLSRGRLLFALQSAAHFIGMLRAMKNIMDPNVPLIVFKVDSVGKSSDKYASKRVKADWIKLGKLTDFSKCGVKTSEKLLPQAMILFFIPLIGAGDISQRLRNQKDVPTHDRNGCVVWLLAMGQQKKDWLGSGSFVREALRQWPDGPAMNAGLQRSNPRGLRPIADARPLAMRATLITRSWRNDNVIWSVSQDPTSISEL